MTMYKRKQFLTRNFLTERILTVLYYTFIYTTNSTSLTPVVRKQFIGTINRAKDAVSTKTTLLVSPIRVSHTVTSLVLPTLKHLLGMRFIRSLLDSASKIISL